VEEESEEHESFSDVVVHQLIETIEFVLGSVSNTASYLRLWALSLAHSQLSEVFFTLILGPHLVNPTGYLGDTLKGSVKYTFLTVAIIAIILCTDTLECFLHTLRLHWYQPL
jgi:V-type H+-transporting ATPase subunit a